MFFGLLPAASSPASWCPTSSSSSAARNLTVLLRAIPSFGMVALGVGLLMIAGEFDLSVGAVFVVAPFAMAFAYCRRRSAAACRSSLDLAIAARVGLANGLITLRFGIPSFITTLGMLFIVRTSAPFIVGYSRSITFKPPAVFREVLVGISVRYPASSSGSSASP